MATSKTGNPTADSIFKEYDKSCGFKTQINLYETVKANENFFIGKQWEGVTSNGLPTPIFNFIKRVVLFQVASILSDNIKIQASPLSIAAQQKLIENLAEIVTNEFEALFEYNQVASLLREYMRNAAVDGDGCTYTYWDETVETGRPIKGAIVTEIIENTRVHFGNPNERRVQRQPFITIERREMPDAVRERAEENGIKENGEIVADTDTNGNTASQLDERCTVLTRMWRAKNGFIWACESVRGLIARKPWNMGIKLYPITWLNWDYIQDCYHGQAMVTGLIPNQIFVNKTFAMVQLSLMSSAYPKIIYDKTRIANWTNQIGVAIGVNGGDMNQIAKVIEPAQISPQIAQFIESTINYTQTFLGATSAALGDTRPDNTSAIIALQRASSVPSEITKQNLYQSVEELGNIYLEFMIANYGEREVKAPAPDLQGLPVAPPVDVSQTMTFDFSSLRDTPMKLKLDVGASSYFSEMAALQTLDNLLMNSRISTVQYLERLPSYSIPKKESLIEELKREQAATIPPKIGVGTGTAKDNTEPEIPTTAGYSSLQRKVAEQPVA